MSLPPSSALPDGPARDAHKAVVVARVKRQRERWQSGRATGAAGATSATAASATATAAAQPSLAASVPVTTVRPLTGDDGFRSVTMQLITRHPALAVAAVGLLLAMGPRRLARTASWLLPTLLRRY